MPESEEVAPAWFRSAENMIKTCKIPDEAAGSTILPFLNEKSPMLIANKSVGRQLLYAQVIDAILEELKLTPEEYRRRLYGCKKGNETWGQFVTKIEVLLDYYLRSRDVRSLDELRLLLIADRAKQLMDELRSYVLQHTMKDWLKPKEVVSLAQKFEDSRPRHRAANQQNSEVNGAPRADRNREPADKNTKGEHRPPPKCYSCGRTGHLQYV
ncbi:hypothetical protein HPB48_007022 [Haemaphysalis longicornis]|uniref:CCHC-type domain-containing protein n=1 Tax=Haemaphysalis longicornis TaxID=44386 RepID=A0A9J6FDH3_HAELO|nr:hypothetical protein HPB48_007022 [Haemaphysalis longicornis]